MATPKLHPKGKTARRATESLREESAKKEPYQCECQCENSAGHHINRVETK